MHVFDLKSAFLAKHAQHVVLIHFPIALFLAGVGFDFAASWKRRALSNKLIGAKSSILAAAAHANLLAAAVSTPPVVVSGILAWQWQLEGQRLHGVLLLHLILGCLSTFLITAIGWIHLRSQRSPTHYLPNYRLPVELVAALVIVATSHLGGFLSGVNLPSAP